MANQSKFSTKTRGYFDTLPYTCYECAHTWEPSCIISWYDTLKDSMKFSLKIYVGFYMVSEKVNIMCFWNLRLDYTNAVSFSGSHVQLHMDAITTE